MKKYTKPELKITSLNNEETVLVSGGLVVGNFTAGGYTKINW